MPYGIRNRPSLIDARLSREIKRLERGQARDSTLERGGTAITGVKLQDLERTFGRKYFNADALPSRPLFGNRTITPARLSDGYLLLKMADEEAESIPPFLLTAGKVLGLEDMRLEAGRQAVMGAKRSFEGFLASPTKQGPSGAGNGDSRFRIGAVDHRKYLQTEGTQMLERFSKDPNFSSNYNGLRPDATKVLTAFERGMKYKSLPLKVRKAFEFFSELTRELHERLDAKTFRAVDPMIDCHGLIFGRVSEKERARSMNDDFVPVNDPQKGDIVIYFDADMSVRHSAIVVSVDPQGKVDRVFTKFGPDIYSYEGGVNDISPIYGDYYGARRLVTSRDKEGSKRRTIIGNVRASGNSKLANELERIYFPKRKSAGPDFGLDTVGMFNFGLIGKMLFEAGRKLVRGARAAFGRAEETGRTMAKIIEGVEPRISAAKTVGAAPVALFDIDGTVINARKRVRRVLKEALDAYPGRLPYKQEILFNDADLPERIDEILKGDKTETMDWWNAEHYLRYVLGSGGSKRYPQLYEFVTAYFKEHFFKLGAWEPSDAIGSTIDMISDLRSKGARIVFVSLRGASDDIDPSTRESHTIKMLKAFGAWRDGDELVLKDGESSALSSTSGARDEKSKLEMVLSYFARNSAKIADPAIVAIVDNDPHQLRSYFERFKQALYVYVKGDLPPKTSERFPKEMTVVPLTPRNKPHVAAQDRTEQSAPSAAPAAPTEAMALTVADIGYLDGMYIERMGTGYRYRSARSTSEGHPIIAPDVAVFFREDGQDKVIFGEQVHTDLTPFLKGDIKPTRMVRIPFGARIEYEFSAQKYPAGAVPNTAGESFLRSLQNLTSSAVNNELSKLESVEFVEVKKKGAEDIVQRWVRLSFAGDRQPYTYSVGNETMFLEIIRAVKGNKAFETVDGMSRLPRLNAFHRLLCGDTGPENVVAIDNAPRTIFKTSVELARAGSTVVAKDPYLFEEGNIPQDVRKKITRHEGKDLNKPSPAKIVYWTDPYPDGWHMPEYMARDVLEWLVIQTDDDYYKIGEHEKFGLDLSEYELVFRDSFSSMYDTMLPTNEGGVHTLLVFRKISAKGPTNPPPKISEIFKPDPKAKAILVNEHGRLKDLTVNEALKLFEIAPSLGGLLNIFASGDYLMPIPEDQANGHWWYGLTRLADFISERGRISREGNSLAELIPLYVQNLRAVVNRMDVITWEGKVIGAVSKWTSPYIAHLMIVLETLRSESADVIEELLHHAPLADLNNLRDGIVGKIGTDPFRWQELIDAYDRRDRGASIQPGGGLLYDGKTEKPTLEIPADAKLGGPSLPWDDHPLFSGQVPSGKPRLGGPALLEDGFTSVTLPGGVELNWRYQYNTATQAPEIVFTGDSVAVAFATQYLAAANGGSSCGSDPGENFFPFSTALGAVETVVTHSAYHVFSNTSGVYFRFNPKTLMQEGVFTRVREYHHPGINTKPGDYMRPEQLLSAWQFALDEMSRSARQIELLEQAEPNRASILHAMQKLLQRISPEHAKRLRDILTGADNPLASITLPDNVWQALVGVTVDPATGQMNLVIKLYANKPLGAWGPSHNLRLSSDELVVMGTPQVNGRMGWTLYLPQADAAQAKGLIPTEGGHWLATLPVAGLDRPAPPRDSIVNLPAIPDSTRLAVQAIPDVTTAAGDLMPFVPTAERIPANELHLLPLPPDKLDIILSMGGTLTDDELTELFPDPVRQTWQTLAWAKRLIARYPQPWLIEYNLEHDIAGLHLFAPNRRRLAYAINQLMRFETKDPTARRDHIQRMMIFDMREKNQKKWPRVMGALVDRARLALAAKDIDIGILSGIEYETGMHRTNCREERYSFSRNTVRGQPDIAEAMQTVRSEPRLKKVWELFKSRTGITDEFTFLEFLEFEVGIQFKLGTIVSPPVRADFLKWVKLRDDALWAVPNKEAILGDRFKDYALIHDAISILNGKEPTDPPPKISEILKPNPEVGDSKTGPKSITELIKDFLKDEGGFTIQRNWRWEKVMQRVKELCGSVSQQFQQSDLPMEISPRSKNSLSVALMRLELARKQGRPVEPLIAEIQCIIEQESARGRSGKRPAKTEHATAILELPETSVIEIQPETEPDAPRLAVPATLEDRTYIPISTASGRVNILPAVALDPSGTNHAAEGSDRYVLTDKRQFERTPLLIDGYLIDMGSRTATFGVLRFISSFAGAYPEFVNNVFLERLKRLTKFEETTRHSINEFRQIRAGSVENWTGMLTLFLLGSERSLAGYDEALNVARKVINSFPLSDFFNAEGRIAFRTTRWTDEQEAAENKLAVTIMERAKAAANPALLDVLQKMRDTLKLSPTVVNDLEDYIKKTAKVVSKRPARPSVPKDKIKESLAQGLATDPIYIDLAERTARLPAMLKADPFALFRWIRDFQESLAPREINRAENLLMAAGLTITEAHEFIVELSAFRLKLAGIGAIWARTIAEPLKSDMPLRFKLALISFLKNNVERYKDTMDAWHHIDNRMRTTSRYFQQAGETIERFLKLLPIGISDARLYVLRGIAEETVIEKRKRAGFGRLDLLKTLASDVGAKFLDELTDSERAALSVAEWFREMYRLGDASWQDVLRLYSLPGTGAAPAKTRRAYEAVRESVMSTDMFDVMVNHCTYPAQYEAVRALNKKAMTGRVSILHGIEALGFDAMPFAEAIRTAVAQKFFAAPETKGLSPKEAKESIDGLVARIIARNISPRGWSRLITNAPKKGSVNKPPVTEQFQTEQTEPPVVLAVKNTDQMMPSSIQFLFGGTAALEQQGAFDLKRLSDGTWTLKLDSPSAAWKAFSFAPSQERESIEFQADSIVALYTQFCREYLKRSDSMALKYTPFNTVRLALLGLIEETAPDHFAIPPMSEMGPNRSWASAPMEILALRLARQLSDEELVALLIDNLPHVINDPAQIALIDSVKAELRKLIPQGVKVENPFKFVGSLAPASQHQTFFSFTNTALHALGLKGTPLSIRALHEGLRLYIKHGDKHHNELRDIIDFWLLGETGNEDSAWAILNYLEARVHDTLENPFEAAIALGKLLTRGTIKDPRVIDAVINELQGMIDGTTLGGGGVPAHSDGFFPRHLTTFKIIIDLFKKWRTTRHGQLMSNVENRDIHPTEISSLIVRRNGHET